MKNYKQILEAVNRGIQLALDDFDDEEQVQHVKSKQVQNRDYTKEYLDTMDLLTIAVDLGLPSRTLWCKYNLGCDYNLLNNHPQDTNASKWYGGYYSWGETINKSNYRTYDWKTYRFGDEWNSGNFEKYNHEDNLTQLDPEDDAAYQGMYYKHYKFHIPTKEQVEELIKYTSIKKFGKYNYYEVNGKEIKNKLCGLELTSKLNGNKIFFPFTGYYNNYEEEYHEYDTYVLHNERRCGVYWTLDLSDKSKSSALCMICGDDIKLDTESRFIGMSIRPVINL